MSTNFFPENGTVQVSMTDEFGNAMEVKCLVADIPSAVAGYAVGCELIAEDTGAHYYNTGTTASCSFVVGGTVTNGSITLAKLATGITPSHIVKYAGQSTTVGGAASEAFTVTGIAATDLAFVQIVDNGTENVTALQAVCTTNTLTVTFSADPDTDTVFNYQILRAAA
jgi:hypothetical protein